MSALSLFILDTSKRYNNNIPEQTLFLNLERLLKAKTSLKKQPIKKCLWKSVMSRPVHIQVKPDWKVRRRIAISCVP